MNRLRAVERRSKKFGTQKLAQAELDDFHLWIEFLEHSATTRISINNITYTTPDISCISDACEHGIGGFTNTGLAYSIALPPEYLGFFHIILLEFLAAYFTIRIALEQDPPPFCNIAHLSDNTSAIAWMRKSSFDVKSHPEHNESARIFVRLLMTT